MANAKKTADISDWTARKAARVITETRRSARLSVISSKKFEDLTAAEKDILLKQLGVQLGLIRDSN